jgi:hypothetical protein
VSKPERHRKFAVIAGNFGDNESVRIGVGVAGRAANKIALRSSVGIVSPEASGARQAVAMLTHSMREVNPAPQILAGFSKEVGWGVG